MLIEQHLVEHPPHPEGKGEYIHDRRLAGQNKRRAGHREIRRGRDEERRAQSEGEADTDARGRTEYDRDSDDESSRRGEKRRKSTHSAEEAGRSQLQGHQNTGADDIVTKEALDNPELQRLAVYCVFCKPQVTFPIQI